MKELIDKLESVTEKDVVILIIHKDDQLNVSTRQGIKIDYIGVLEYAKHLILRDKS